MPVRRLRSLEDAEDSLVVSPDDPALWSTIAAVWELADRLCPRRFPPGVYRHRDIEAHNSQREAWDAEAIRSRARETASAGD